MSVKNFVSSVRRSIFQFYNSYFLRRHRVIQCLIIQQNDALFSVESFHIPVYFVSVGETPQVTSKKRCLNSRKYEEDFLWVYWSHKHCGWMCKICEMYPTTAGHSKSAFLALSASNIAHPGRSMNTHGNSK